jgi:hypothetical protein
MILISATTLIFWLRPTGFRFLWKDLQKSEIRLDLYLFCTCSLGVIFFISCFFLGVWISVIRMRGPLL